MIFLVSYKTWEKYKKWLVKSKDYIILDATDDEKAKLSSYTNVITVDGLAIPSSILKYVSDKDFEDSMDFDRVQDLENTFFRSMNFEIAINATIANFVEEERDMNFFIVIRDKAYKYYRNKLKKEFVKRYPSASTFLIIMSKDPKEKNKKDLKEKFPESEREPLKKMIRKREEQMTEKYNKTKKKKHKKSKDGWGLS